MTCRPKINIIGSPLPILIVATQGSDEIIASIRYWDKAGTEKGGAYTAGVLMHHLKDGRLPVGCG